MGSQLIVPYSTK